MMIVRHSDPFTPTPRTRVKRAPQRGTYDRQTVYAILDEALYCHVGFVVDRQPFVIPTIHVRVDDRLYIHGSTASRMIRTLQAGAPTCITVTLLDGLVLARSAFHHSMNYRSVVVLGTMTAVTDPGKRMAVFNALVEHIVSNRSTQVRPPNEQESKATALMSIPLDEVSAKMRTGPVNDDEADYELPVWAGVLPLALQPGDPVPDERLSADLACPDDVRNYIRRAKQE